LAIPATYPPDGCAGDYQVKSPKQVGFLLKATKNEYLFIDLFPCLWKKEFMKMQAGNARKFKRYRVLDKQGITLGIAGHPLARRSFRAFHLQSFGPALSPKFRFQKFPAKKYFESFRRLGNIGAIVLIVLVFFAISYT
jgi:hypothetical protein